MVLFGIGDILSPIKNWFQSLLENLIYRLFYLLETLILRFVRLVEDTMMIFTGEKAVTYDKKPMTLIDVFFSHGVVRSIYTAIAITGIMIAFAFAIVAVVRKIGDLRDKQQGVTLGAIMGNLLKSILLIVGMNVIVIIALSATNALTSAVTEAVQKGVESSKKATSISFTNEHYAAMGRIINTIGNYSLNPSYRSRYNLNACYNDIREDLAFLADQGVFDFHYVSYDENNSIQVTWQSLMEKLGTGYDFTQEAPLDAYDDGLTNALLDCMEAFRKNQTLRVLSRYESTLEIAEKGTGTVPMDRILFLVGTMGTIGDNAGARNDAFNENPSFFDAVRQPFYTGQRDIYDWNAVKEAFDPSPIKTNYILVYIISVAVLMEMVVVIVTCAVRIFNLLALYIASPLAISSMPMDDGGKFKQWTTAFIVQLLGVVGMVLSMRLFLAFLPIVWGRALSISDNMLLECIVKSIITYGGITAVNKVNGIFTGILADNAGYQAILAGDVRGEVGRSAVGRGLEKVSGGNVGGAVAGAIGGAVTGGISNIAKKWGGKLADATGLSSVGRSLRGAAEAVGIVSPHDKSKDPETVKQGRERDRLRDQKKLAGDVAYAEKHGTHRDGKALEKNELNKMKKTLGYMENGKTLGEAKKLAAVDMKHDDLDRKMEAAEKAKELPTNMRNNQDDGGGDGGDGGGGIGGGGAGGAGGADGGGAAGRASVGGAGRGSVGAAGRGSVAGAGVGGAAGRGSAGAAGRGSVAGAGVGGAAGRGSVGAAGRGPAVGGIAGRAGRGAVIGGAVGGAVGGVVGGAIGGAGRRTVSGTGHANVGGADRAPVGGAGKGAVGGGANIGGAVGSGANIGGAVGGGVNIGGAGRRTVGGEVASGRAGRGANLGGQVGQAGQQGGRVDGADGGVHGGGEGDDIGRAGDLPGNQRIIAGLEGEDNLGEIGAGGVNLDGPEAGGDLPDNQRIVPGPEDDGILGGEGDLDGEMYAGGLENDLQRELYGDVNDDPLPDNQREMNLGGPDEGFVNQQGGIADDVGPGMAGGEIDSGRRTFGGDINPDVGGAIGYDTGERISVGSPNRGALNLDNTNPGGGTASIGVTGRAAIGGANIGGAGRGAVGGGANIGGAGRGAVGGGVNIGGAGRGTVGGGVNIGGAGRGTVGGGVNIGGAGRGAVSGGVNIGAAGRGTVSGGSEPPRRNTVGVNIQREFNSGEFRQNNPGPAVNRQSINPGVSQPNYNNPGSSSTASVNTGSAQPNPTVSVNTGSAQPNPTVSVNTGSAQPNPTVSVDAGSFQPNPTVNVNPEPVQPNLNLGGNPTTGVNTGTYTTTNVNSGINPQINLNPGGNPTVTMNTGGINAGLNNPPPQQGGSPNQRRSGPGRHTKNNQ